MTTDILTVTVNYLPYSDGKIELDSEEGETAPDDVMGRVEFDVVPPAAGKLTLTFAGHRVVTKQGKITALPGSVSWPQPVSAGHLRGESFSVAGVRISVDARPIPAGEFGAGFQYVAATERDLNILRTLSEFDYESLQDAIKN